MYDVLSNCASGALGLGVGPALDYRSFRKVQSTAGAVLPRDATRAQVAEMVPCSCAQFFTAHGYGMFKVRFSAIGFE